MGFRTQEEEGALDGMSLDEYLIGNKEAAFLMRAASDSMREAAIVKGDLLVVDRSKEPKRGDIVIAVEDGNFVMRRMPVRQVEAVVTAVIRKFQ